MNEPSKEIDFKALLEKYMKYVDQVEGSNFVSNGFDSFSDVEFTDEEWNELTEISKNT